MRIHCLGVGAIGSLLATRLQNVSNTEIRLILRRKDAAKSFVDQDNLFRQPNRRLPTASIDIEEHGVVKKTSNLQVELSLTPADFEQLDIDATRAAAGLRPYRSNKPLSKLQLERFNRDDDIETLVVATKAPNTVRAIERLVPRLSSRSTIVIVQNGMGVLEQLIESFWPDDPAYLPQSFETSSNRGRPSFVCATTTHSAWRKSSTHVVHSGFGDVKFAVVPNGPVIRALSKVSNPSWGSPQRNPVIDTTSNVTPTLEHLDPLPDTVSSLYGTVSRLLASTLNCHWLSYPAFQIAQLEKLAVNASANALTALMGVHNGAILGSPLADSIIEQVATECSNAFAAHLAATQPDVSASSIIEDETHPLSAPALVARTRHVVLQSSRNISSTLSDLLHTLPYPARGSSPPSARSSTEIEYIHGYVSSLARRYGLQAPTCETLGRLVLLKESSIRAGAVDRLVSERLESALDAGAKGETRRRPAKSMHVSIMGVHKHVKTAAPLPHRTVAAQDDINESSERHSEEGVVDERTPFDEQMTQDLSEEQQHQDREGEVEDERWPKTTKLEKFDRGEAFRQRKRDLTELDLQRKYAS